MSDTTLRYLKMLQFIPRSPRSISTLELKTRLDEEGFDINLRSIQRDLEKLSASFPLVCDDSNRPFKWFFDRDAAVSMLPALDMPTAITFELTRAYLTPLLPPRLLSYLEPHFREADSVLKRNGNPVSHWPEKIRFISRGFIGTRPDINADHFETITEAIINNRVCEATYQARNWQSAEHITLHPLGLIFRDPNTYLIAKVDGREGVRQLVMHRFVGVKQTDKPAQVGSFDIDALIQDGEMRVLHSTDKITLELLCKKPWMNHLLETPLDESQQVSDEIDDHFTLQVSVHDSRDLRWWLIAQSAHVKVKQPAWLREEITSTLKAGLENNQP